MEEKTHNFDFLDPAVPEACPPWTLVM
jgi:hypothetical protein